MKRHAKVSVDACVVTVISASDTWWFRDLFLAECQNQPIIAMQDVTRDNSWFGWFWFCCVHLVTVFFRFSMIAKWLPETILPETSIIRANCFHKPDWGHIYNFGVFCALFGYFRELFLCGSPYLVFTVWAYVKNTIKHQFFGEVLHILCNFDLLVVKCVISAFDAGS